MNTKKSTKKLNKFKTSPLIAVIAVVEVIILVCACTFAWFVFSNNTTISTKLLSVEPDSGLEIDFSAASEDDYVVVNQYILDNFKFEPVTSTDGRNIFIPTTGTFANTVTENIAFREATVNDMNSKYICIDFTLTNTGDTDMPVFLSTRSTFKVSGKEGKALRLAFYQNDGSSGDIDSTYYQSNNEDDNVVTVYFRNTSSWEQPYAYAYNLADGDNIHNKGWPGVPMTKISSDLYYYTFSTKYDANGNAYANPLDVIMFSNGKEGDSERKTYYRTIENNYIFTPKETATSTKKQVEADKQLYTDSIIDGTYPIVSPGVSVGFQRQYAPVTNINNTSGSATAIVPAYANSIDNYSYGSTPLFTIEKRKTMSLSMIVWLEGTDVDCTSSNYSGREIDLNLIFATSDNNDVQYSTYTFYDKTYETWIAHETESAAGGTVKPVMQLYDNTIGKGYLMNESDYVVEDGVQGRANTWTVEAPDEILTEGHDIIFRRVNPLDENEIWNYWDASGLSTDSADEINGVEGAAPGEDEKLVDYYHFTAFSDGSPANVTTGGTTTPQYSCGGLWGKYDTSTLKLYDGTRSNYLDDDSGVMTINYSYNGQSVEYKASGPAEGFYTFIIPNSIYNNTDSGSSVTIPEVTFKRFYNFNGSYALNSDKQENITYDNAWSAGTVRGRFFEINQYPKDTNNEEFITYWGDEVIYIQNEGDLGEQLDNGAWRVKFTGSDSGDALYTYLYKHYKYYDEADAADRYYYSDRQTVYSYGYPCVVPSEKEYTSLQVEQCSTDTTSLWNRTSAITLSTDSSGADYSKYSNVIKVTEDGVETIKNILKLTNLQHTIYFQIEKVGASQESGENAPNIYVYNAEDTANNGWPGESMEYVSTNSSGSLYKYKASVNVTKYNKMIFTIDLCDDSVYLVPNDNWKTADAWFAAYFFNDTTDVNTWVEAEYLTSGIYRAVIPDGTWEGMIWCRMNPYYTVASWDAKWNQTQNLDVPTGDSRVCYVSDWSNGSVGTYTGGDNGTDLLKSNTLDIGTSSNKNGEIYEGDVTNGGITVKKLDVTEDGVDTTESVVYNTYFSEDWP